ncbi:uncharacterized protein BO96DRAFT_349149 [Aspergillus niger CBS 101883]|uniref:Uncharacterized protein n=2 Tax=Aspergillus niger TaxID=5061 RepID=A2RAZ2_ASPNC|nr:uncharacterized protein BO96DRAFT_349149 [Aspergillus niger CBS 101883]XP_059602957.1 hypothetical protein An18g04860 [Aspergillus niger]PYH51742.1 hypothetical protein BO96DRAFT_349149 [Aspergillus niger CBS 101883]CAK43288.1 hypothetical protein An18g04860 [Aspergillus niger]
MPQVWGRVSREGGKGGAAFESTTSRILSPIVVPRGRAYSTVEWMHDSRRGRPLGREPQQLAGDYRPDRCDPYLRRTVAAAPVP